jgi:hypothetical protein
MFKVGNANDVLREIQLPIVSQGQCKKDYNLIMTTGNKSGSGR